MGEGEDDLAPSSARNCVASTPKNLVDPEEIVEPVAVRLGLLAIAVERPVQVACGGWRRLPRSAAPQSQVARSG